MERVLRRAADRPGTGGSRLFDAGYSVMQTYQLSPSQQFGDMAISVTSGGVDFDNRQPALQPLARRPGDGAADDHLLQLNGDRRWLDVSPTARRPGNGAPLPPTSPASGHLHLHLPRRPAADRCSALTTRDVALYDPPWGSSPREQDVTGSALFSCKLNWQTVVFLGCSDDRSLAVDDQPGAGRPMSCSSKISYAFQRWGE